MFLCGIAAALLVQRVSLPRLPGAPLVLLALAVCAVPFSPINEWHMLHHLPFAALAAAAVALSAAHPPRLLASAALRRIGEVSYSMYLVHFALLAPSLWLAERLALVDDWRMLALHMLLTTGASFAAAGLLHRWIETPGIRLGAALCRRLPVPRRAGGAE